VEFALKQAGVVQVGSAEELIDTMYAFLYLSRLQAEVGVMGGGGAIGVAASDSWTGWGFPSLL
jgi:acyl-CoA synthetase (NDP forming)